VFEFLKKKEFVSHVLKHLGTSAVSDLLLRLITCVEGTNIKQGVLEVRPFAITSLTSLHM
jgi:serine/threonine-protein phosphatase 6 regulatory subunit 2